MIPEQDIQQSYLNRMIKQRLDSHRFWGLYVILGIVVLACGALLGMAGYEVGDIILGSIGLAIIVSWLIA